MTDEKLHQTVEFILESQAKFYDDLQELQKAQHEAEKRAGVLERVCLNLYNTTVEHGKQISQLTDDIKELRDAQKETETRLRETDRRLNAILALAEKFFGNRDAK